jgi:hypothetical protein
MRQRRRWLGAAAVIALLTGVAGRDVAIRAKGFFLGSSRRTVTLHIG